MFHSGELEASFQGLDAFLVFVYFERESLGAGDTPREGQGGDVSCYSGSTQSESWESHGGGVCVQLNLGGEASNSSLTTLCFKINLNRTVKSILRLYKCFLWTIVSNHLIMTLVLLSEQHSSQSVPDFAEEPSHFLFSLSLLPSGKHGALRKTPVFLLVIFKARNPGWSWMVVSKEKVARGSGLSPEGQKSPRPQHLSACLWVPKWAWARFIYFFLSEERCLLFISWKKEFTVNENRKILKTLTSELEEREMQAELEEGKNVFSLEKSYLSLGN